MNIANYPGSHFAYASIGDLHAARKDTANAISNYEKALSIMENAAVRQKLAALQAAKAK